MAALEAGQARMRHPDPTIGDQIVAASQVPHLELSGFQFVEGDRENWPEELLPFGGQQVVRIYHPDLDAYGDIAESAVPYHRERGWQVVEAEPEASEVAATDDLDSLTVAELQDLARERALPVSGTKGELLERIRSAEQESEV